MSISSVTRPALARPLNLRHLDRLVDARGIVQFARGERPDLSSGYCVDDVARLGVVAAGLSTAGKGGTRPGRWARLAVHFLWQAWDPGTERLHNLMDARGRWLDEPHHGDHTGRAIWALGELTGAPLPSRVRHRAARLRARLAPTLPALARHGLRPVAYAALGLTGHSALSLLDMTAPPADWPWFEPQLTYDNARLPQALLRTAVAAGDRATAARALAAIDWYAERVGLPAGPPRLVGNLWWRHGQEHAGGDEQPLDAAALAEALTDAWLYTGEERYAAMAARAFGWFHGDNAAGLPVYDPADGGCRDGLGASWTNRNKGAESTLAYHQALLRLTSASLVKLPVNYPP
ncbi:hypothetical protein [Phytomonospora endophytica]|uniref:Glycosyltransferase n=1 Tax=Phytomonospora endophytica TaxID=714109 RepID=A0A841FPS2_9ACTN|nr:hypothetical protein [Phytomonospora endophytica]MBB6038115.1 hypothetical protein [Phytomonospora endophytica]GIG67422.1 hypothetical protein Pen01_37170 [Phytomonospora endophytica]